MSALGPYEIGEQIGQLALGEVVEACRAGRTDAFALLLVDTVLAQSHRLSGLLRLEVSRAAGVRHPSLVRTIEVAQPGGRLVVVADRPPGLSLARALDERKTFTPSETIALIRLLAEALDAAHARRVFSGDLSPESVFLGADGVPRLLGIGLVMAVATDDRRRVAGLRRWLPGVAPEVMDGGEPTAATDGYAFGACTFLLLTGRPPGSDADASSLDRAVAAVLDRQLAPEARQRFPSCVAFVTALAGALPGSVQDAPARSPTPPTTDVLEASVPPRAAGSPPASPARDPAPPLASAPAPSVIPAPEATLAPVEPRPIPRLRWQDEPDPPAPSDALLPAVSGPDRAAMPSPAPRPGRALTEQVEPTPELLGPIRSAFRWRLAGALFWVLLPSLFFGGLAVNFGADSIGLPGWIFWLGMLGFQGGPAVVGALAAWDTTRAPRFERVAGRIYVSEHSYARNRPSAYAYLPNGVTIEPDSQAARALERAGTEVPLDEVRVERDRLTKVVMVEGEIVYSAALPLIIEVRRTDGTEVYTEPNYRLARRIAERRAAKKPSE